MMQLKLQLHTLKKGTSSMTEYLMKKKSLIDALLYSGNVMSDDDKIMYVLGGLGPEYDPFVIPITSINGCYSLPEITALLLTTHESRLEQHTQSESLTVNMAANSQNFNQNRRGNGVMQQYGNGRGHVQGNTQGNVYGYNTGGRGNFQANAGRRGRGRGRGRNNNGKDLSVTFHGHFGQWSDGCNDSIT
ncbi:hypothetical protein LWI28_017622 [Acer negundo]|uniref:UBN2 domain-containing protein n=1 Tax=Acer negundo TaxID=4023 RepID=A0AAD5JDT7_ACENE|nr:hypothetical protein LWI28_017622 [Acer negundo]KAK4857078.1 hypothetical protein QYF36_024277 [Acer negundo]